MRRHPKRGNYILQRTTLAKKIIKFTSFSLGLIAAVAFAVIALQFSFANPRGGTVETGSAVITQAPNTATITQSSDKAVINWQSFNIAAPETTRFVQPSASSITLNRINPAGGASQIYGQLLANGRLILINGAGIYFGPSAYVNVGGIIASTADISTQNFMAGNYRFDRPSIYHGAIINDGSIHAEQHGLVALMADGVVNNGYIQANSGAVILASGATFTVGFDPGGLINFTVDSQSSAAGVDQNGNPLNDGIRNSGIIIADGGKVLMTARAATNVLDNAINMDGVAQANTVRQQGGVIILAAGKQGSAKVSGKIIARGHYRDQAGGNVKVLGNKVKVSENALIDVSGMAGGGEALIGGNARGLGPDPNAAYTYIGNQANILANALESGNGGHIVVFGNQALVNGNLFAQGGALAGNGGLVETSGEYIDVNQVHVNTLAPYGSAGTWLLDPANITISTGTDANYTDLSNTFTPDSGAATSLINTTTLNNALASNSIIVTTTNNGASGGSAGTITISDPLSWSADTSLTLTADSDINFASTCTGTACINATGSGSAVTLNANSGTGSIIFNAGGSTIPISAGSMTLNGSLVLNQASTLQANIGGSTGKITVNGGVSGGYGLTIDAIGTGSNASSITGNITGTNTALTKANSGTLNISGSGSTYTGSTTVSGGTLSITHANALGNTSGVTVSSGASLDMNFAAGTLGNTSTITLNGTGVSSNGALTGTGTGDILNNPIVLNTASSIGGTGSLTLAGIISGAVNTDNLTKVGSGTISLTGLNTYLGTTTISAGTLVANTIANNNTNSSLGKPAGAQATITLGSATSATLSYSGSTDTSTNRAIILGGLGGTSTIQATNSAATLTLDGSINNNGDPLVFDTNSGNIIVSSNISGAGSLSKTGPGTLTLTVSNTYSGSTSISAGTLVSGHNNALRTSTTLSMSGGTFDLSGFSQTLAGISGTGGTITNSSTANTLTTKNSGTDTFAGILTGALGLTMSGNGSLTLSGNNSFTGATTISNGTLSLANTGALGNTSDVSVNGGGTLDLALANNSTLSNTSTITLNSSGSTTLSVTSGAGTGSTLILNNPITLASNANIGGTGSMTLAGIISGTKNITVTGGTITLSGANTYTNGTTLTGGTLRIGSSSTGAITNGPIGTGTLTFSGGTLAGDSGNFTIANTYAVTGGNTGTINGTNNLTLSGNGTLNTAGSTLFISNTANTITLSGSLSDSGALTQNGTGGTLVLSGANSYKGATTISNGLLKVSNAQGLGNATNHTSGVTVASGAELDINNVAIATPITLSLIGQGTSSKGALVGIGSSASWSSGAITLTGASTIGTSNASDVFTINGTINGNYALTFAGSGTITLSNTLGNSAALSNLTANSSLTKLAINTTGITSVGNQSYNSPVTLGAASLTTLTSTANGNISFGSTLNGPQGLSIAPGTGSITWGDTVGGTTALGSLSATASGATNDLTIAHDITASGNISLTAGRNISLNGGNLSTTGNISLTGTAGTISAVTSSTTNKILNAALLTTSSVGGTTLNNTNTVAAFNATNTSSGDISLTNSGSLNITGISQAVGSLSINNSGAITQSGSTIVVNGANQTVTLAAGSSNNITLGSSNNFSILTVSSGNDVNITDSSAIDLKASTISGNLTLSSSSAISQSGVLTVGGTSSFTAGTSIALTQNNNLSGNVTLSNSGNNNVALSNISALILGNVNIGSGSLTLGGTGISQAAGTSITQAASAGAVSINAGAGSINLSNTGNSLTGTVSLNNSGNHDVTLTNSPALILGNVHVGSGTLSLSGSGISQAASTTITQTTGAGSVSINAGNAAIDLSNAGNNFYGAVSLNNSGTNSTALNTSNALILGTSSVGSGIFSLTAGGAITQTGAISATTLNVTSSGGVTLNKSNTITSFSVSNSSSGNISLTNTANTLTLTGLTASGSGNITVSNTGALTSSGTISTSNGSISLSTVSPDSAARTLTIDGALTATGGTISLSAANPAGSATPLVINSSLTTTAGSGGTLFLSSGVTLNVTPSVGAENITLNGNGLDQIISSGTLSSNITYIANRYIVINGTISSSSGYNLGFIGDYNTSDLGGVLVTGSGAINSGGDLTIKGSNLNGLNGMYSTSGVDASAGIQIQSGASVQAAGNISLSEGTGNANIDLSAALTTTGAKTITLSPAGSGNIQLGANLSSSGGTLNLNGPANLSADVTLNSANINFNNNINGDGHSLTLTGNSTSANTFKLTNTVSFTSPSSTNIIVNGNAVASNSLTLSTNDASLAWTLTNNSNGSVSGNHFGLQFSNIQNLTSNNNNSSLQLANQNNALVFNGAGQGLINTRYFNGFSIFQSASGNDTVRFNVPVVYPAIKNPLNFFAIVNSRNLQFLNFNYQLFTPATPPPITESIFASVNAATVQVLNLPYAYSMVNQNFNLTPAGYSYSHTEIADNMLRQIYGLPPRHHANLYFAFISPPTEETIDVSTTSPMLIHQYHR